MEKNKKEKYYKYFCNLKTNRKSQGLSTVELIIYSTISTLLFGAAFLMVNNLYRYYSDLNKVAQVDNYAHAVLNRLSNKFEDFEPGSDDISIYETFFIEGGELFYENTESEVQNFYSPSQGISVTDFSLSHFSNPKSDLITIQLELNYLLRSSNEMSRVFKDVILIKNYE